MQPYRADLTPHIPIDFNSFSALDKGLSMSKVPVGISMSSSSSFDYCCLIQGHPGREEEPAVTSLVLLVISQGLRELRRLWEEDRGQEEYEERKNQISPFRCLSISCGFICCYLGMIRGSSAKSVLHSRSEPYRSVVGLTITSDLTALLRSSEQPAPTTEQSAVCSRSGVKGAQRETGQRVISLIQNL